MPSSPSPASTPVSSPLRRITRFYQIRKRLQRYLLNLTVVSYGLIGVWALSGAIATLLQTSAVQKWERQSQRFLYTIRGMVTPPDDIVILEIDQDSLKQGDFYWSNPAKFAEMEPLQSWPFQRSAYATVIERLLAAGAKVVSIDVIFTNPSVYGLADDQQLAAAIAAHPGQVILATPYETYETNDNQISQIQMLSPTPDLAVPESQLGNINFLEDVDGRIYHFGEFFIEHEIRPQNLPELPTFASASLAAAGIQTAAQPDGDIFFYGPPGTFRRVSFWHVLDSTNWQVHLDEETFRNKIVLIGATATSLQDFVTTPFVETGTMPGIEVHANAIATLMENRVIHPLFPAPWMQSIVVLLGVAGVGGVIQIRIKRPDLQLLTGLAIAAVWGGVSYGVFTWGHYTMPTAVPMGAIALGSLTTLAMGSLKIQLEKRQLRQTLERYVAAPVAHTIMTHHSEDFQNLIKGRRIQTAILFSDIRGFTTLSLGLKPEVLIEQLNAYLEAMVQAIMDADGTVDKFIGDAVMAEFGSPISQGEHQDAMNAVRAALSMRRALTHLHDEWEAQDKVLFFNGIGINYGEAIVGDIGSTHRREYAVIGDAVNVASRVEGMTRKFWTDILITEPLYTLVKDEVEVVPMGEHELKGRGHAKVNLYSLVGLKGDDPTIYQQMLQRMRRYHVADPLRGNSNHNTKF